MDSVVGRGGKIIPVVALVGIHGLIVLYQSIVVLGSDSLGLPTMALDVAFAAVLFFLAYSVWSAESWAWLTVFVVEGINAAFSVVTLVFAPRSPTVWMSIVVAVAILALLALPDVRATFGRAAPSRASND